MKLFALLCFFTLISSIIAQDSTINLKERPITIAIAITLEPAIDGKVLNDEVGQKVKSFGPLSQVQPNYG